MIIHYDIKYLVLVNIYYTRINRILITGKETVD